VRRAVPFLCCLAALLVMAPMASAQPAYVANSASNTVSVLDTATNSPLAQIPVGAGPTDVAITPDGTRAYVANAADDSVSVIATATNSVIATIGVGDEPKGLAITPDGSRLYVANTQDDSLSVLATASNSLIGTPIAVGAEPEGIAITPEGIRALVAQRGGDISVVELASGAIVGVVPDPLGPAKLAISPDGSRGFAANKSSNSVSIFSAITATVLGVPILVGANPSGVALSPGGPAYASSASDNTVSMIDPVNHARIGPPIPGFSGPAGIAASADGTHAYVANSTAASVSVIDAATASVQGQIPTGAAPTAIAIVPDQPPHAFFASERDKKQGQLIRLDASSSSDSDGQIATYSWDFGDGQSESGPSAQVEHTYARPGPYRVSLTLTDEQGCSTAFLFTGQTASCNGSAIASSAAAVRATDTIKPLFRLKGAHRQFLGPFVLLEARCPKEDCRVEVSGALDTALEAKRGPPRRAHLPTARARASIPAGGKATIRLRLGAKALKAARAALRAGGRAKLAVRATARDGAGNISRRKLAIQLLGTTGKRKSRGR
jgi:YVTN family beta-propeller protein